MSFSNIKYYQSFVTNLKTMYNNGLGSLDEEELRNLFSRGYYSIYLHARDTLNIDPELYNSHESVIRQIPNQHTKRTLQKFKKLRKNADYDEPDFIQPHSQITNLFSVVDQILNFTKEQLEAR